MDETEARIYIDRLAAAAMGDLAKSSHFLKPQEYLELLKEVHDRVGCSIGYISIGRQELTITDMDEIKLMEDSQ